MNSEKTLDEIEQRKDSNNTKMADVSVEDLELNEYGLETMEKDSDYEMDVDDEEEARKEEEEEQDEEEENQEASGTSTRASRSRSVPGRGRKSSSDETTDRSSSVRSTRLSVNPDFAAKHRRFLNRVSNSLIDEATRTRTGRSRERSGKMSDKSTTRSQDRSDKSPARSQDKSDKPAVKSESDKSVAKSQEVSDKISDEPAEKLQDESDSDKPETKSQNGSGKISDKSAVKSQNKSDKMADKTEKEDETEKENDKYECENNGEASSRRASRSRSSASETRNTAKRGREDDEEEEKEKKKENGGENAEEEQQEAEEESPKRKRRTIDKNSDGAPKPIREGVDMYCWKCHREGSTVSCKICPRVFHLRCLHLEAAPPLDWVCPECSTILYAENTETRSPAMKSLTLDQLCNLLKFTLARMKSYPGSEWFCKPVDTNEFPAYSKYVVRPMDLSHLEKNIKQKRYGSTQAFYADTQWLLHNSVIFNTYQSKLTNIAKVLVKIGKQELDEIETCPECYLNAHTRKDSWFIEACKRPHLLVWAKLKGFPFWPAKAMKTNSENLVDVRFFGAHDRAWIPVKNVYLYSKLNPGASKNKRKNQFDDCISEVQQHIKKLRDKFGEFVYPSFKCSFDASKEDEQLEAMLPGYKTASRRYGKLLGPVRNFNSPSTIILKEVKKEPQDSPKNKTSLEKNKINRDEDNSRSFNGSKSSNIDEDIEEEEEENDDSSVENGEEGDDKKEKNESITASSASSSPNTKGKPTPTKGDLQVKTPTKSMDGEKSFYNKEEGNKSVEEVKGEDKRKKNEEVIEEPSAKIQQLNDSSKEVKQTPEKSLAKTDFAASLQEKLQRMMKKDTAMNSLESKTYEIEDEDEKDESKCGSDKEGENVENGSDGGMDDNDGGIDDNDDGIEDVDDGIDDVDDVIDGVDDVIDGVDDDTTKDKEKSIENQKEKGKEKQQEKDGETSSTEKTSNEELVASSSINLVSEDDEPKEKHEKGRLRVCDLKSLGVNETVSIKVEHVDDDHDYHASSKSAKVLDTISATIEEVVQNSSLMASKKVSDGSGKLTGIVDTLSQFSKGFERLSRNSAITIAKSETVIDCDEEDDLDIDNPRLISLLKARDPSCCSPEEMERVFSPSRRKGFPSKVRRNGSSASSTCSSEVSSVEELKRICAEQESRNEVERKRPSTTPIDELAEDSYSVLDEVSGQFMKKRMEKGNVTITLVSDDESSTSKKSNPDKSQPKGSVSLSRDVSLSIVRDDSARKDLSLDMECVESDADEVEGGKVNKSGWSSETPIQMKPTARKSFPNAAKIVTKTRDSGSEMRRMSAADIQLMNQQNGGVSTSSAKVSPVPSPKNQTNTSASFYTKISKIAASSPASEEVQISNTMSLKMINPVDSSTSSTSKTASKSSPSPILPLSVVHVVPSSSSSSLSATVAPIPSTSSAASSRPLLSTTAVTQAARVLPQLQLKPPSAPSAASTSATSRSLLRGHFGPATGRMDAMSQRLSESMMQLMEDMLNEMAHEGRFEARLKQMQLELERTQWKHRQEMAEYKHNTDLMIMEMRAGFEAERHRAIMDVRMKCQAEKEAAINETKMKQWCALCKKEALFYCCWNTAYCNYPCQQEHWPQHMANCAQTSRTQEPATNGPNKAAGAKMMAPFTATQKSISIPPTQNTASSVNSVMPPAGQTYPGPRSKTHSHMNQAQFIRQNLQVAATTALMSSTAQESNSNKVKQHSSSPLYHSSANPLHHTLPPTVTMTQPNVSSSGLRMMRAPLMCRPPIGFTIRPPQYLVSPRAPVPIPPPGYYQ